MKEQIQLNNQISYSNSNVQKKNNKIINIYENKYINFNNFNHITNSVHYDANIILKVNSIFLNKTNLVNKTNSLDNLEITSGPTTSLKNSVKPTSNLRVDGESKGSKSQKNNKKIELVTRPNLITNLFKLDLPFSLASQRAMPKLNESDNLKLNSLNFSNEPFPAGTINSPDFDKQEEKKGKEIKRFGSLDCIVKNNKKNLTLSLNKNQDTLSPRTEISNKKVDLSKLNRIKKGSLLTQKVYDSFVFKRVTRKLRKILLYKYLSVITTTNSLININPNLSKKNGSLLTYNRIIGYNFLKNNVKNKLILSKENINVKYISEYKEDIYKLLFYFFKSIFCLISKPTVLFSPDKITIKLFYYLVIPRKNTFNLFALHYFKSIKQKWINKQIKKKNGLFYSKFRKYRLIRKSYMIKHEQALSRIRLPFIRFKQRKAISRLKAKSLTIQKLYFSLNKFNIVKVFYNKFYLISNILSSLFNKPVELNITRVHRKSDSNILANFLQLGIKNKRKKPRVAINKIYKNNRIKKLNNPNLIGKKNIIAFLSGLNIYINGRLMREAIIPKRTTKKFEKGATATGKVNYKDTSTITKKNRKGAYTIKVKAAQNFF
jgi:hypothetical protein